MSSDSDWLRTACNLCSLNCGIEIEVEEGRFGRIKGDRSHPESQGYLCQKASRLDYYQNHAGRLTHPLRRRPDGVGTMTIHFYSDEELDGVLERLIGDQQL